MTPETGRGGGGGTAREPLPSRGAGRSRQRGGRRVGLRSPRARGGRGLVPSASPCPAPSAPLGPVPSAPPGPFPSAPGSRPLSPPVPVPSAPRGLVPSARAPTGALPLSNPRWSRLLSPGTNRGSYPLSAKHSGATMLPLQPGHRQMPPASPGSTGPGSRGGSALCRCQDPRQRFLGLFPSVALTQQTPSSHAINPAKPGTGGRLSPTPLSSTGLPGPLPPSSALQPPCRSTQQVPSLNGGLRGYTELVQAVPSHQRTATCQWVKKEKKFIVQSASFVPNYTHTLDNINRGTGPAVRFPCDRQGWKMLVPQSRATSPCFHQHIQCNIGLGSIHIYILI